MKRRKFYNYTPYLFSVIKDGQILTISTTCTLKEEIVSELHYVEKIFIMHTGQCTFISYDGVNYYDVLHRIGFVSEGLAVNARHKKRVSSKEWMHQHFEEPEMVLIILGKKSMRHVPQDFFRLPERINLVDWYEDEIVP